MGWYGMGWAIVRATRGTAAMSIYRSSDTLAANGWRATRGEA